MRKVYFCQRSYPDALVECLRRRMDLLTIEKEGKSTNIGSYWFLTLMDSARKLDFGKFDINFNLLRLLVFFNLYQNCNIQRASAWIK